MSVGVSESDVGVRHEVCRGSTHGSETIRVRGGSEGGVSDHTCECGCGQGRVPECGGNDPVPLPRMSPPGPGTERKVNSVIFHPTVEGMEAPDNTTNFRTHNPRTGPSLDRETLTDSIEDHRKGGRGYMSVCGCIHKRGCRP